MVGASTLSGGTTWECVRLLTHLYIEKGGRMTTTEKVRSKLVDKATMKMVFDSIAPSDVITDGVNLGVELYRGRVTQGPSMHSLVASLSFEHPIVHPNFISLPFCIDPFIKKNGCDIGALHLVICGLKHKICNYSDVEIEARLDFTNEDIFATAFGINHKGWSDFPEFRIFLKYSVVTRKGEIVVYDPS